jgi:hypothetical protein
MMSIDCLAPDPNIQGMVCGNWQPVATAKADPSLTI